MTITIKWQLDAITYPALCLSRVDLFPYMFQYSMHLLNQVCAAFGRARLVS